jgi:outer membrane murein-binding lipoprotein Lpp
MKLAGLAALVLAASPLVAGCSSDPTCADVDSLQSKLDGMNTDDPDYNSVNEDLNRAQADCNA